MEKTILVIALVAVAWHLGVFGAIEIISADKPPIPVDRLLRLAELDLLKRLRGKLEGASDEEKKDQPYENWLKEVRKEIRRIKNNRKHYHKNTRKNG